VTEEVMTKKTWRRTFQESIKDESTWRLTEIHPGEKLMPNAL